MSQETTEGFAPLTLEQLTYFQLDNGALCFVGNVDDICKHVDALEFAPSIYYVLTIGKFTEKKNNITSTEKRPALFKVVKNLIGRAVVSADDEVSLDVMETSAWFGLPRIPYLLVKKMDTFFRTVHDMYGTEAIVILTYDPSYSDSEEPSNGWGILVPEQENTSGACDYVADSIVDEKPEQVVIVGSAHSHPGMSAFASGTDHKDQASFDGLHITYGWMKSKDGGATEFHIELQMGGKIFSMTPDQIFGDIPADAPDDEVQEWTKKVTKKTFTTHHGSGQGKALGSQHSTFGQGTSNYGSPADRWKVSMPSGCPDLSRNIIIGVLESPKQESCQFCGVDFLPADIIKRRCMACHNFLAMPGETLEDILNIRMLAKVYAYELDVAKRPPKGIHFWFRNIGDTANTFTEVYDPAKGLVGDLGK